VVTEKIKEKKTKPSNLPEIPFSLLATDNVKPCAKEAMN